MFFHTDPDNYDNDLYYTHILYTYTAFSYSLSIMLYVLALFYNKVYLSGTKL